ncbi:complement C1q subcomponent subunit B-like [Xiphophorus maculatus]|uniref:Complement C1q subcomponent subunit B-like n=1 Tax=Xiphophorus maculatus TaxID=8083 RepID=A0A3B5R156_XIPMA|nr:complement C1q subcomponent subunit B-like [Xiphophorus maculatus]
MKSSLFLVAVLVCGLVSAQQGGLPERVQKLEADNDVLTKSRVAFSAALVDTNNWTVKGPLEADETLKFERVITNIGNGYDPATGLFTAPVKGLYYIQVTGISGPTGELHAGVKKNRENMFAIYQKARTQAGASNAMVLVLEQGDRVYVQLWAGKTIADQGRLSIFTGFLVFPM